MTTPLIQAEELTALCPGCGYSLVGLPVGHPCPECGEGLPPETILLWGEARPQTSSRRSVALVTSIALGLAVFGFVNLLGRRLGEFGEMWAVIIACAVITAHFWWERAGRDKRLPGSMQLRLNASGYGTRSGFGPVRMRPWKRGWKVRVHHPEFSPTRTIVVYRPLLGMLVLSEPLRFSAEMSFAAANDLAARIQRWIDDHAPTPSPRAGAVGVGET